MYLDSLHLENFRLFRRADVQFIHPDTDFEGLTMPRPTLPNMTLLLGDNGSGKSAVLKAAAMALLGRGHSAPFPFGFFVRRERSGDFAEEARVAAKFRLHARAAETAEDLQEAVSEFVITRVGWAGEDFGYLEDSLFWRRLWHSDTRGAFLAVGYGAARGGTAGELPDVIGETWVGARRELSLRSLFQESRSLVDLSMWLPDVAASEPSRFEELAELLAVLLDNTGYTFAGQLERDSYVFARDGVSVPFTALSDGCRAYLSWVGDLLYWLNDACPADLKLVEIPGLVLIDEIDLHLHPSWQMRVLPTLAKALPNLQFIVTSHSPLVLGSLEWMNVLMMRVDPKLGATAERLPVAVHGLDADQLLLTGFFGLTTTRAGDRSARLRALGEAAARGESHAALALLRALGSGTEPVA